MHAPSHLLKILLIFMEYSYRQKALKDLQSVTERVDALVTKLNIDSSLLPADAIETFCKNAAHIKLIQYRSIKEEHEHPHVAKIGKHNQGSKKKKMEMNAQHLHP